MNNNDYLKFDEYLNSNVFIIHDEISTKSKYKKFFNTLYNYMKEGFEEERVRKHPIYYKFTDNTSEEIKQMEVRHCVTNLIFWKCFMKIDKTSNLNSSHIVDCKNLSSKYITNYINDKIILPHREDISNKTMNRILSSLIHDLSKISLDFNPIMGMSINIRSFTDLAKRNKRFNELIRTHIEIGAQPKEIEDILDRDLQEMIQILKTEKNVFQPMLLASAGIKDKQLCEFMINGGLKPDLSGNVIATPIDTNFLVGGLNSVTTYYIDAQSGNKASITNKTSMGVSGYFATKVMMSSSRYTLSSTEDCCDSIHPIRFYVKTKKHLEKINNCYYYLDYNMSEMKLIDARKDTWLIGRTIYVRSPLTCTAKDGVCHKCYGSLYKVNLDKQLNVGGFAATQATNKVQQDILSTKHLLTTRSDRLVFPTFFDDFFVLDSDKIRIKPDIENIEKYELLFDKDYLYSIIEMEEADFNTFTDSIIVRDKVKNIDYEIKEMGTEQNFYLNLDFQTLLKPMRGENYLKVNFEDIPEDIYVALIVVKNNELTKPLKNFMKLLDKKDLYGCKTVEDLFESFCDLTIEANIPILMCNAGFILKGMVRDADNILQQPHFDEYGKRDSYQMLTISDSLLASDSLTTSLSFDNLLKQFNSPLTNSKYGTSNYDPLYALELEDE